MKRLLLILLVFSFKGIQAQEKQKIDSYESRIRDAKSFVEKIDALNGFAEFCYVYNLDETARNLLERAVDTAKISHQKEILLQSYFTPAILAAFTPNFWTKKATFDYAIEFMNNSLQYAVSVGDPNYIVLAHTRLAHIYRERGQMGKAQDQLLLAIPFLSGVKTDNTDILFLIEQGNIHQAKGDALPAFENYSNALKKARQIENFTLTCEIYHHLFELFSQLGDSETALKYLDYSVQLNEKNRNNAGLCWDYIDYARETDKEYFAKQADEQAAQTNSEYLKLYAKRESFALLMGKGNLSDILSFLKQNKDFKQFQTNAGIEMGEWFMGNNYLLSGDALQAVRFYRSAEDSLVSRYDNNIVINIYQIIGIAYKAVKCDSAHRLLYNDAALIYYQKAYKLAKIEKDIAALTKFTLTLMDLYEKTGKIDSAFIMSKEAIVYNEELQRKTANPQVALQQLKSEEETKQTEKEEAESKNYTLITVVLVLIFLALVLSGSFRISPLTLKVLGYLAFVSLFEYFVLHIDHWLHNKLPVVWVWVAKVIIIAGMVPLQHFLEHKVVKYLENHKLLAMSQNFIRNALRKKTPRPSSNDQGELI